MKKAIQRIISKDMKMCKDLDNIKVIFDENDVMKAKAIIFGLPETRYEFGCLLFDITFPKNYPFVCPIIKYIPINKIRIHPNIYACGNICLSLLGTWSGPSWTSIMDLSCILLSIQSLLDENPIRNEPGYEYIKGDLNDNYNKVIEYNSLNSSLIDTYLNLPEKFSCFHDDIKKFIIDNKDSINDKINKYKDSKKLEINISLYYIHKFKIDYEFISNKFSKLIL